MSTTWQSKCRERLQEHANRCFCSWVQSSQGMKWKNKNRQTSPYTAGFNLPDWHHDIISALNRDDEVEAKYLTHLHLDEMVPDSSSVN